MPLNRVVALATAVITLALGVLPVVGNFDWTSTAGVLAGTIAVLGVALKWLDGWQKHEARQPITQPGFPSVWTSSGTTGSTGSAWQAGEPADAESPPPLNAKPTPPATP